MRHFRRNFPDLTTAARVLLLLPFLLVALLPQGYMPSVEDDGTFTVTLCTGDGLRTVTLDADGNEVPDVPVDDEDDGAGLCVFAGTGQFAAIHAAPVIPAPASQTAKDNGIVPVSLRASRHTGALGARAPPVLL